MTQAPLGTLPPVETVGPGPGNVLAHELSARYLQPLLDLAGRRAGAPALARFLEGRGARLEDLRDQTNWISLRFCESLVDWLSTFVPEEELVHAVTAAAVSPRTLGFLYPFLRAFGSPRRVYESVPGFNAVMNRVSAVRVFNVREDSAEVEFRPAQPQWKEHSPLICALRRAQFAAAPALWGLPSARLDELECQARGGERCHYRLTWTERTGRWRTLLGGLGGVLVGLLLDAGLFTAATLVAGAALGLLRDRAVQYAALLRFNAEQAQALRDAASASERRFLEVQDAKAQVDRRVAERTEELQRAQRGLEDAVARLQDASRVKDEFLANVSHELRTPLTLILAPLDQLLASPDLGPAQRDMLGAMRRSAGRLHALVNDLLDLARLEAGHLRLVVAEDDLCELVRSAVQRFRPLAQRRNTRLEVDAPDTPVPLWMDAGRMDVVMENLLSNALKFTPEGGVVRVLVRPDARQVALSVVDSGPGIDPALQARVFGRFERFDVKGVGGAGTGIGLAMVKGVVELHGGTISLTSALGEGTSITLLLRTGREHLGEDSLERRRRDIPVPFGRRAQDAAPPTMDLRPPDPSWQAAPVAPADAPRVLVVEDHDDLRAFLVRVLSTRFVVTAAADGVEGLALAHALRPDAVVTDVGMPRLDGRAMASLLKEDPQTRAIPIIMLTAQRGVDRVLDGLGVAEDYVTKPFVPAELLARVEVHVRLRRLTSERVHAEKLIQLGTLAAGLAHEVNNPATALLGILPRLRRELARDASPRTQEALATCEECAHRIVLLVQDLLNVGRPDREGAHAWDLNEGVEATVRLLRHRAPPGVHLSARLGRVPQVQARPAALNQVFLNLLDNALRAVGEAGSVVVETRARDGGVAVTVQDSGPGIPPHVQTRIFDPFFTTRQPGEGTGLGLHISMGVVRDHGGTLSVSSEPGAGALFTVWLPAVPPKVDASAPPGVVT
jgi:signal transduction histidine kinase